MCVCCGGEIRRQSVSYKDDDDGMEKKTASTRALQTVVPGALEMRREEEKRKENEKEKHALNHNNA